MSDESTTYIAPEPKFGYPAGPKLDQQIKARHRRGQFWYVLLGASLIVSILALIALLYTCLLYTSPSPRD